MPTPPRSFYPPRRLLLGPGPTEVPPRVLAALARPTLGHLDPDFVGLMDSVREALQRAFRTDNRLTLAISAPASAGMEACVVNLVEPGDQVVVCVNGTFGARLRDSVERSGGRPVVVESAWGEPVDPDELERTLEQHPGARLAAFVHAETSTGALSDAQALSEIARRHGCLTLCDAVTSLGGSPLEVDAWGIDAVYSGSQKCLSCVPGLSPASFSPRAVARIRARRRPVQSWFLDLTLVMAYWGDGTGKNDRVYHHTAPVNSLYALHEALLMLEEEGLEQSWARHRRNGQMLWSGLEAMGLELLVEPPDRLPQLAAVRVPAGIDEKRVRRALLEEHGIEIGGGLGPLAGKIWRIGLLGQGSSEQNVRRVLGALEAVLAQHGVPVKADAAVAAARAAASPGV